MSIKITYVLRRHDTRNFHGWIVWECWGNFAENEYYSTTSYEEACAIMRDLGAM